MEYSVVIQFENSETKYGGAKSLEHHIYLLLFLKKYIFYKIFKGKIYWVSLLRRKVLTF